MTSTRFMLICIVTFCVSASAGRRGWGAWWNRHRVNDDDVHIHLHGAHHSEHSSHRDGQDHDHDHDNRHDDHHDHDRHHDSHDDHHDHHDRHHDSHHHDHHDRHHDRHRSHHDRQDDHHDNGRHIHIHMHMEHDRDSHAHDHDRRNEAEYVHAHCEMRRGPELADDYGHNIHGQIHMKQRRSGGPVDIDVHLTGFDMSIPPHNHDHAFHIHEYGDMVDGCASLGPPFDYHLTHGSHHDSERRSGDFGNISCDANATAHRHFSSDRISIIGRHSVVGRSLVVHQLPYTDGSKGSAGIHIACCIIGRSRPHDLHEADETNQQSADQSSDHQHDHGHK